MWNTLTVSSDATETLVMSLVLSRLDYCNSPLTGTPQTLIDNIQRVMNCASRLIQKSSKRDHITPLMINLHWLPASRRIEYTIETVCFNGITNSVPPHVWSSGAEYPFSHSSFLCWYPYVPHTNSARSSRGRVQCHALCLSSGTTFPSRFDMLNHSLHSSQLKTHLFSAAYISD